MSDVCALPDDDDAPLPSALIAVRPERLGATRAADEEFVAEEAPIALEYNGLSHAVMLATPLDLEDFALGFSLTEGLLASPADLLDVEVRTRPNGVALQLRVTARCEALLKERRRSMAGRTGCGLCGTDNLDQVFRVPDRPVPPLPAALGDASALVPALSRAMRELAAAQPLQRRRGHPRGGLVPPGWRSRPRARRRRPPQRARQADRRDGQSQHRRVARLRRSHQPSQLRDGPEGRHRRHANAGRRERADAPGNQDGAVRGLRLAGFVREGRATLYA